MSKKRGEKKRKKLFLFIIKIGLFLGLVASLQLIDIFTFTKAIPPNKIYLEVLLFCAIFLFVSFQQLLKTRIIFDLKKLIIYGLIALILFLGVLSDNSTLNQRLQYDLVDVHNGQMHFDRTSILGRVFGINTVSNSYYIHHMKLKDNDTIIKISIDLKKVPEQPRFRWYSQWFDWSGDDGRFSENSRVILDVNGNEHDVTQGYVVSEPYKLKTFELQIPKEEITVGRNFLTFRMRTLDSYFERVDFYRQTLSEDSFFEISTDGGATWKTEHQFIGFFMDSEPKLNFIQMVIVLYKSYLIFLGTIFLFIAIFGTDLFKKVFKKLKKEFIFSLITIFFLFSLFNFIKEYWRIIAVIVAKALNILLYVFPVELSMDATRTCPLIEFGGFSGALCGGCSGVESMAIFTAFFLLIVLLKWHRIDLIKTTILFIIGFLGTIVVNTARLFLLFTIAHYISPTFAMNAFHTNVGWILFVAYALFYGYFVMPYMMKK